MEENGLTFKEYPEGRVKIDLDSGTKTVDFEISRGFWDTNPPTVLHTLHTSATVP
jgi:hypothetical protein